jgi:hypothetical protein
MKKIIFFCVVSILTLSLTAQTVVIQSTSVKSQVLNDSTQKWYGWQITEADCIVTIDIKNSSIKITNQFNDVFKLSSIVSEVRSVDLNDNDPYVEVLFNAVDNNGIKLIVITRKFDSGIYHVGALYHNLCYTYEGKVIKF